MTSEPSGLARKNTGNEAVEQPMIDPVLWLFMAAQEIENLPSGPDRNKHRDVCIADLFEMQPGCVDHRSQLLYSVSPLMPRLNIVGSPESLESGHEDHCRRSRFEHTANLCQPSQVIIQMFDDIERGDEIEGVVGEGQRGRACAENPLVAPPA